MRLFGAMTFVVALAFGTASAAPALAPAERNALLKQAGFTVKGGAAMDSCDSPAQPQFDMTDINGDGQADVTITDGSGCYGGAGAMFAIFTKDAAGKWSMIANEIGMASWKKTKHHGWPDLEVGGPGMCFPVEQFDGTKYKTAKTCP